MSKMHEIGRPSRWEIATLICQILVKLENIVRKVNTRKLHYVLVASIYGHHVTDCRRAKQAERFR